jgi:membrane protease YdiL (CAAX protease family)
MSITNQLRRSPLVSFFVLAYGWTWLCWAPVIAASAERLPPSASLDWLATCGQFGPFAAAFLVAWALGGREGLGKLALKMIQWRASPGWLGVSLMLLPVSMLLAVLLFAFIDGSAATLRLREPWTTLPLHFVYLMLLGGALGEEPGWSGFALPRLQERCGPVWASLWLGLLRAGWHLPLWWMYPPPCSFPLFVAGAVLLQFLTTWLFNHTCGSVLYCMLFHTSLSVASVRLPDVPAYHLWILCLMPVVLLILWRDRGRRPVPGGSHPA